MQETARRHQQRLAAESAAYAKEQERLQKERERLQWEADAPAREAARLYNLREKYAQWRVDNSRISRDDWVLAALASFIPFPFGFIGSLIFWEIGEALGHIQRHKHGLDGRLFEYGAGGWAVVILCILWFVVKKKRQSGWGTIAPDIYKDVA
jgi:hypothetical protein